MINKIPLPTDNIYKFYALFGLILFIFGFASLIYVNKSTNNLVFDNAVAIETLESLEVRTSIQATELAMLKKRQDIAVLNKKAYIYCIGIFSGVAVISMFYGFRQWHTKVQPLQDELLELTVKKIKADLRFRVPNKQINKD